MTAKVVDRAISIIACRPAPEGYVAISGLSRVHKMSDFFTSISYTLWARTRIGLVTLVGINHLSPRKNVAAVRSRINPLTFGIRYSYFFSPL